MNLKNEIRKLQHALQYEELWQRLLSPTENNRAEVLVTRSWYGNQYPGLGKHMKYNFDAHVMHNGNSASELRGVLPFSYKMTIVPAEVGYILGEGEYPSGQRQFGYALTLKGAERKVHDRAKRVLDIVERKTTVKRSAASNVHGFVRL